MKDSYRIDVPGSDLLAGLRADYLNAQREGFPGVMQRQTVIIDQFEQAHENFGRRGVRYDVEIVITARP